MKPVKERRKLFMKELDGIMMNMDPSGANKKKYHDKLDKLSDKEFDAWATDFLNDDKQQLYLEIMEFDRELTMEECINTSKFLGVPLYERVASPHLCSDEDNVPITPYPVPVGYAHIKRLQQFLLKKNSGSTDIKKKNSKTGQVTGEDKNGRNSDAETYALLNVGAMHALAEFMGPKGDDPVMQAQMMAAIANNGFVSESDMTSDPLNKVSLATMDMYFTMQGLRTNIYTPIEQLPKSTDR